MRKYVICLVQKYKSDFTDGEWAQAARESGGQGKCKHSMKKNEKTYGRVKAVETVKKR